MKLRWQRLIALSLVACGPSTPMLTQSPDAALATAPDTLDASVAGTPFDTSPIEARAESSVAPDSPVDGPPDSSSILDVNPIDAAAVDVSGPESFTPSDPRCAALKPLADKGVFTTRRSQAVFFSPDLSWLVLRTHVEDSAGIVHSPKLVRIDLPSGEETVLSDSGGAAEALGSSGAILLTGIGSSGADLAVYDRTGLRTIATGICDHSLSPDGSRVYVIGDCTADGVGSLKAIDVATAETTLLSPFAVAGKMAVSPGGGWVAFVTKDTTPPSFYTGYVRLASVHGDSYRLNSPGATSLRFLSENRLLFSTTAPETISMAHIRSELFDHAVGTGGASTLLVTNTEIGLFGYQVSADGNWLLLAQSQKVDGGPVVPAVLLVQPLDQARSQTLTSNLLPYWDYQLAINAFEFSAVGDHAVYATYDDGLWSYAMSSSTLTRLSSGGLFVLSPTRAELAIREIAGEAGPNSGLRLVGLDGGPDLASFASDATLYNLQYLADGRGLVFVETRQLESGTASTLRYIARTYPDSVALAQWEVSHLTSTGSTTGSSPFTYPTGSYPVDPTSCFTIADVDGSPGPGTQLILLPQ